ncbi:MAG: extracellular solute-binding protein [Phycisphaerae bacterium]|nr:extracellular solute-binding protein [Phycisphaerae bacterium]
MFRRLWDAMEDFPPGRVPLLLIVFAIVSGGVVAVRSAIHREPKLTIWTFTHISAEEFKGRLKDHPDRSEIKLENLGNAMFDRLSLAVMTQKELPDLVEIEQTFAGQFLRGPVENAPFVDLTDRIHGEGWDKKCVYARLARYSHGNRIYGIPHDLHPMVLVYRPDVLESLGLSPEQLATWDDWIRASDKLYHPGAMGTEEWRRGIVLSTIEGFDYLSLLWQRGGDIFDADGQVIIDSPLAVDTLEFYRSLFEGEHPVAGARLSSWSEDYAALSRGQFVAYPAPDWMLAGMQMEAKTLLEGKVRCMPLPAWEPGGRRTSTSGGTAMFIPKGCADEDRAWALAKFLYFDRDSLIERFRRQTIVPALHTVYDDPVFDEEVAFFQGQKVGRLLTELAMEVPPVQGSPYISEAYNRLNAVFSDVMAGRLAPEAALKDVARRLRETIARDQRAVERVGGR